MKKVGKNNTGRSSTTIPTKSLSCSICCWKTQRRSAQSCRCCTVAPSSMLSQLQSTVSTLSVVINDDPRISRFTGIKEQGGSSISKLLQTAVVVFVEVLQARRD
jgi:hypothetical protein